MLLDPSKPQLTSILINFFFAVCSVCFADTGKYSSCCSNCLLDITCKLYNVIMSKHSKLMFTPFMARCFSYPHIKRLLMLP